MYQAVAENFVSVSELESCCQGLEANSLLNHTTFHMDLQLLVLVALLMRCIPGGLRRERNAVVSRVRITQEIDLSHILC